MKGKKHILFSLILVFSIMTSFSDAVFSRPDENMDDLLQGFENDPESDDEMEKLLEGFEDEADRTVQKITEPKEHDGKPKKSQKEFPAWDLTGDVSLTGIYNFAHESPDSGQTDWRGLSMLRSEIELQLEGKLTDDWQAEISVRAFYDSIYALRGKSDYTRQVLDEYEDEIELEDTFIQGRLARFLDTKIGRQIVAWGTLDNVRVTDILNPMDLRVPGLTDIDDLRLPVTMIKLDYYPGNWNLSGMVIPEIRFNKMPVYDSDFFPSPVPWPREKTPDDGLRHAEYAAALTGIFSGWDMAFYWANVYNDQPYIKKIEWILRHTRIHLVGTAFNRAMGNWLIKGEAAWLNNLKYANTPGKSHERVDLGCGIEYSGFSEATISLEAANRYIRGYRDELKNVPDEKRRNEFQWALRFSRDYWNDTLAFTLLASTFGVKADDGAFERLEVEYDISDALSIRGGVVLYQSGDKGAFKDVGDNDRLFTALEYSF